MNNTTISIRTNQQIKEQAQTIFSDLGIDMSTAVNIFLRQTVRERAIPFSLSLEKTPTRKTQKAIHSQKTDGPFADTNELMEYLHA